VDLCQQSQRIATPPLSSPVIEMMRHKFKREMGGANKTEKKKERKRKEKPKKLTFSC
jgi:hypothetical protein